MCGLASMILNEKTIIDQEKMVKIFTQLLAVSSLRGADSTGVATIRLNKDVEVFKRAIPSYDYLDLGRTDQLLETNFPNKIIGLIGHVRAKTVGHGTNANAHPFQRGNITLIHNGTLTRHASLTKSAYTVDSDAIACALAESDTIRPVLESLDGAFALVWHNSETNTMYMARNKERPLSMAITESGTLIMASESKMIDWLTSRNDIKVKSITELPVGLCMSVDLDTLSSESFEFTPKVAMSAADYYSVGGAHGHHYYGRREVTTFVPKPAIPTNREVVRVDVILNNPNNKFHIVQDCEGNKFCIKGIANTSLLFEVDDCMLVETSKAIIKLNGVSYKLAEFIRRATAHEEETFQWDVVSANSSCAI